jgi:beta-lactam-binding protein with PASTA domain
VPKVKGKKLKVATHKIKANGCRVGKIRHASSAEVKKGHVLSQRPKPHTRRKRGAKVNLIVGKG